MNDLWAATDGISSLSILQKKLAAIIYVYKWMIFELLLMVYKFSQSIEEISYHYIHVQMNDLWAATDGISILSIYRRNKLPLYTCTNEWSLSSYWWYIKSLNL